MSLTGANVALALAVPGLFDTGQVLQGFAVDDVFDSENVRRIETAMGVDGVLSAGLVFYEKPMTIHLQSDSPSIDVFDQWIAAEEAQGDVLPANMTARLTGLGTVFACVKGFLTVSPPLPSVKRLIQPRAYTITWESITPAPTV